MFDLSITFKRILEELYDSFDDSKFERIVEQIFNKHKEQCFPNTQVSTENSPDWNKDIGGLS